MKVLPHKPDGSGLKYQLTMPKINMRQIVIELKKDELYAILTTKLANSVNMMWHYVFNVKMSNGVTFEISFSELEIKYQENIHKQLTKEYERQLNKINFKWRLT